MTAEMDVEDGQQCQEGTAAPKMEPSAGWRPGSGYYSRGEIVAGGTVIWSCGHRHTAGSLARECASREIARRVGARQEGSQER